MYHFNHNNYYLFNINYTSFNIIYSVVSEIESVKSWTWKLQFPMCERSSVIERVARTIVNVGAWRSTDPKNEEVTI